MSSNNAIVFVKPPTEYPVFGEHFKLEERPYDVDSSSLGDGDFVLKMLYSSIDPYQRGRMRDPSVKSYFPGFQFGQPMDNHGIGKVVASRSGDFPEGAIVFGAGLPWAEYAVVKAQVAAGYKYKVLKNEEKLPLQHYVGAIGMPGMTAYSSFYEIAEAKKGETIFISAASGAVGQIVGQIAKREGMRVVGSAGTDAKVQFLKDELNFDAAYNYKSEPNTAETLRKYCPDGIDVYFENVGGETLDSVLQVANNHGRIIACGMISQYNSQTPYGVKSLMLVVGKRLKMQGFIVSDFWQKYDERFYRDMPKWIANGEIKVKEDVVDGLEAGAHMFIDMLNGRNFGKAVMRISKE